MIYFDNAATTLQKPPAVAQAVAQAMSGFGNPGRGAHAPAMAAARAVFEARCQLAQLLGAEGPQTIAFAANATAALNTALFGLLGPGDHAIATASAHNSVLRPLYLLQQQGMQLTILPVTPGGQLPPGALAAALRPNTRAIVATHASNLTGDCMPLAPLRQAADACGAFLVVDGAQTAGCLPVDVRACGADVFCFTGHKALGGPQGTGGLYLRPGVALRPHTVGGSGIHSFDHAHPARMPEALEAGTLNAHGLAGLAAAVAALRQVGAAQIHSHELALLRQFRQGCAQIPGLTLYGGEDLACRVGIQSINISGMEAGGLADALWQGWGIAVRAGAHCAPLMHEAIGTARRGAVRFSFGRYNTAAEVDTALGALRQLAQEAL